MHVQLDEALRGTRLRRERQLAYAVDAVGDLVVSRSGHGRILRECARELAGGGWVFPRQGKVTFYSGLLGAVADRSAVLAALEHALGVPLYAVDD